MYIYMYKQHNNFWRVIKHVFFHHCDGQRWKASASVEQLVIPGRWMGSGSTHLDLQI